MSKKTAADWLTGMLHRALCSVHLHLVSKDYRRSLSYGQELKWFRHLIVVSGVSQGAVTGGGGVFRS